MPTTLILRSVTSPRLDLDSDMSYLPLPHIPETRLRILETARLSCLYADQSGKARFLLLSLPFIRKPQTGSSLCYPSSLLARHVFVLHQLHPTHTLLYLMELPALLPRQGHRRAFRSPKPACLPLGAAA